jgi:hypothetical protein
MKRFLVFFTLLVLVGGSGWFLSYQAGRHHHHAMIRADRAELEWLRQEFKLTEVQFQKVKQLHEDYEPVCAALCERVMASQERLRQLVAKNHEVTPEIEAAMQECAVVKQNCEKAMLGHVYRVSQVMDPGQGQRYVTLMESRFGHPGAAQASIHPEP